MQSVCHNACDLILKQKQTPGVFCTSSVQLSIVLAEFSEQAAAAVVLGDFSEQTAAAVVLAEFSEPIAAAIVLAECREQAAAAAGLTVSCCA